MSRLVKAILCSVILLTAVSATAGPINPYGFGYLAVPDGKDDAYRFDWLRVGVRAAPELDVPGKVTVQTEFDVVTENFDQAFKFGNVNWTHPLAGGKLTVTGGRFLGPLRQVWTGPLKVRTIGKTGAECTMLKYMRPTGAQVRWQGEVDVRLVHMNEPGTDETSLMAWAGWQGLQVFWVEDKSAGCAVKRSVTWWLNGMIGLNRLSDHLGAGDVDDFWCEYYAERDRLRLTATLEMREFEDEEWSFTADWRYAKLSSLRAGYETRDRTFRGGIAYAY